MSVAVVVVVPLTGATRGDAATSTARFTGKLTTPLWREHAVTGSAGAITATFSFTKAGAASVELYSPTGALVGRATGPSPLQVQGSVAAGATGVRVRGEGAWKGAAQYTLDVSYRGAGGVVDVDLVIKHDHEHDQHHRAAVRWGVCGAGVDSVGLLERGGIGVERLDRHRA